MMLSVKLSHLVLVDLDAVDTLTRPAVCGTGHQHYDIILTSCLHAGNSWSLTPDPHGAVLAPRQDLSLPLSHGHAVDVVRVTFKDHLKTKRHMLQLDVQTQAECLRTNTETWTDLERPVFHVQDVDFVVSCTNNQTIVLKQRPEGQSEPMSVVLKGQDKLMHDG